MSEIRASVVIPVKNGAPHLRALLPALRAQALPGGLEIVAVDSGSRDQSASLLLGQGVRLIHIPGERFDHGETRNLGAREACGGVVVFLTQDALPADEHVVRRLVEAVEGDPRIAGAFARQAPRDDADPLTRRDLQGWVAAQAAPRTVFAADDGGFDRLPAIERYALAAFDNVASAVRRDVLLAHPFAPSRFGEDVEWGLAMLRRGLGLAYVPDAVVVHSHRRSARELYRRNYLGHRLLRRLFGLHTVQGLPHLARALAGTVVGDLATLARARARPRLYLEAPAQSVAAVYGQYRGARDEALARPYPPWSASTP
jgi:GT2 family glycosyltransferase